MIEKIGQLLLMPFKIIWDLERVLWNSHWIYFTLWNLIILAVLIIAFAIWYEEIRRRKD